MKPLPSQIKALQDKVKELEFLREAAYTGALRKATEVINRSKLLTEDVKEELVKEVWKSYE